MALRFEQRVNDGLLVEAEGIITIEDLIQANDQIYSSREKIMALKYQIWDFQKVKDLISTADDMRVLAAQDAEAAKLNPDMIIALISPWDLGFGMGRMWEAFVDQSNINTHVFRTREEAESWVESIKNPVA